MREFLPKAGRALLVTAARPKYRTQVSPGSTAVVRKRKNREQGSSPEAARREVLGVGAEDPQPTENLNRRST